MKHINLYPTEVEMNEAKDLLPRPSVSLAKDTMKLLYKGLLKAEAADIIYIAEVL